MLSRLVLALLLLALYPLGAHAAATITVQPSGANSYSVQGTGMDGVGGIDLTLTYDSSALASPTVTTGGLVSGTQGAMLAPNAALPGTIRIAVLSTKPFTGNGTIATVSFASRTAPGGMRPPTLGSVIDTKGGALPAHAYLVGEVETPASTTSTLNPNSTTTSTSTPPPVSTTSTPDSTSPPTPTTETIPTTTTDSTPAVESSALPIPTTTVPSTSAPLPVTIVAPLPVTQRFSGTTSATTSASPATSSTTSFSVPGTVTFPTDAPEKNDRPDTGPSHGTETAAEPTAITPRELPAAEPSRPAETQAPVKALPPKMQVNRSILERFRLFRGERAPDSLKKLFTAEAPSLLTQKPSIAISDGTSTVTLSFTPEQGGETSPNFALSGARLLSINRIKGVWVIEALPAKEGIQASLTVLSGGTMVEYPITVIPPAVGITASEPDFALFLKESALKPPRRDLNRDGRHDFQDDYIYTGHYLIQASRLKAQAQKQSLPGQLHSPQDKKQAQQDSSGKKDK